MAAAPRLSICIPTHHGRGRFLREAVDSVLCQMTDALRGQVEICISDNASEDETQNLIARYSREHPGLFVSQRHAENLGFTQNLMSLVRLAQGDYCWLFSSDDHMAEGGLARVLDALAERPTLAGMTVDFRSYDQSMTQMLGESHPAALLPSHPERTQVFTSPADIFRNCGSVQGNFSMQIFDRRLWLEALVEIGEAKFAGYQYFPYLYLFGRMVQKRPAWLWLPEPLIHSRAQNDYLSDTLGRNLLKYHTLTMDEASRVWGELFGRSSATYQSLMRDNYRIFWSAYPVLVYKSRFACATGDEWRALVGFTRRLFFLPGFWAFTLPALLLPRFVPQACLAALRRTGLGQALRALKRRLRPEAQRSCPIPDGRSVPESP
jgi:abequosyltransferase